MPTLADAHFPDTGWKLCVPDHLVKIREKQPSLLTLDVHAIAYATYCANSPSSHSEEALYEMSYLLAWLYEADPFNFTNRRRLSVVQVPLEVGSCECRPRKTMMGKEAPLFDYDFLLDNVMESDKDYKERLGDDKVYKFSADLEKAGEEYDADKYIVSSYLRYGPTPAFKSFLRKSFLREDFVEDCQSVADAFLQAHASDFIRRDELDRIAESLKIQGTITNCQNMFILEYENVMEYLSFVDDDSAEAVRQEVKLLADTDLAGNHEDYYKAETPVTVLQTTWQSKLLEYMDPLTLLDMIGCELSPSEVLSKTSLAKNEYYHIVVVKDMKGRFKILTLLGWKAHERLNAAIRKYNDHFANKVYFTIPIT